MLLQCDNNDTKQANDDGNANYRCGLQPKTIAQVSQFQQAGEANCFDEVKPPLHTYEHASQVCGVRSFGDKLIHGVFGTERTVQLTRHGRQRAIRRLVRRPAAHIKPRRASRTRCRRARRISRRRSLCAFDLKLARSPGGSAFMSGQHVCGGEERGDAPRVKRVVFEYFEHGQYHL